MKKHLFILFIIFTSAVLAACNTTIEQEREKSLEEVEEIFLDEAERPNTELDDLEVHLPYNAEIAETSDHNAVIEKSNETFVLFHHLNEEAGNDVIYTMTEAAEEEWLVNETFEEKDRFGYVLLRQVDEESYELTTGMDYTKMTTITNLEDISSNAKWMMETVRSIQWTQENPEE
ncbi:hypothetical protein JMA_25030 [Jeotgalibacillus malaysiensis]|uniref:Lipoprotein n=1 Tax=Jeotgalibacillus malaysiensis TaxID=1508404 RepID=A0A0B5ANL3_9BACL|nr:hypothetical protein [Jeotgalibacillus malaysiensis]AJD91820.1 hypothetical protein JMA_25030 [Jeotgalibacillus malaysiensis]